MGVFQVSREAAGKRRFLGSTIVSSNFLRTALLVMAGISAAVPAGAAVFWTDDNPMMMREVEPIAPAPRPQQRQKKLKQIGAKLEKQVKEYAKPVGPLVIAISIERQTLRVFDANGLFAETSVSTGMRGHSTPMGVFSIIQKNKWHRSNIYSGAPMPYMQRITWSGIALHAGALPGYPASHGCIRMPMAFATKIWGWTRMGARVIITPGEISPAEFSHPLLAVQKPVPTPVAAAPDVVTTPKTDRVSADKASKVVEAPAETKSDDLRLKPSTAADRAKTQTADASNAMIISTAPPVMSDATVVQSDVVKSDDTKLLTRQDVDAAIAKTVELPTSDVKPEAATAETAVKTTPEKIMPVQVATEKPAVEAAVASAPEKKKDETRPADAEKSATTTATPATPVADAAPKRNGQIAVLISGKDGKLYVRQNFAPLFETPITIKPSDRPLGTHVFTARFDKNDANNLHWSAVSLPSVPRRAEETDSVSRRRKSTGAIEVKPMSPPNSAAEALDRLNIPADAMAQISDALATGGSIVVSDQGLSAGGETGQGTEFVVPLR